MDALFKKIIIEQLNKLEKDIDQLLKIEGSISDLRDLPQHFAEQFQETLNWIEVFKMKLEPVPETRSSRKGLSREDSKRRRERIVEAHRSGKGKAEIAREEGVTYEYVRQLIVKSQQ